MAASDQLLRNHQLSAAIIDLIQDAREYVFLVTPYFRSWPLLDRALHVASRQEKNIVLILRDIPDNHRLMRQLNADFGFDVILIANLHTKLYLSERSVIVTSMNLYDASQENNYEVGYQIRNQRTAKEFKDEIIRNDILSLKPAAYLRGRYGIALSNEKKQELEREAEMAQERIRAYESKPKSASSDDGYCIRCGRPIQRSDFLVLCGDCYQIWAQFENWEYPEHYCHHCGTSVTTTKRKPLCDTCFRIAVNRNRAHV
jgi:phosphatidylserine/phosphatidylglycerophosphate/cardiolipin synthase-like enzyme